MSSLVLFVVLFLGIMVGMVVGLTLCANTDLGDFGFTDTRRDLLKCAVVSMVTAAVGVGLFQLAQKARVFLGLIPSFYPGLKISWLDFSVTDVMVTGGTTPLEQSAHRNMKTSSPRNIDEYTAGFPRDVQETLQRIRAIIRVEFRVRESRAKMAAKKRKV